MEVPPQPPVHARCGTPTGQGHQSRPQLPIETSRLRLPGDEGRDLALLRGDAGQEVQTNCENAYWKL